MCKRSIILIDHKILGPFVVFKGGVHYEPPSPSSHVEKKADPGRFKGACPNYFNVIMTLRGGETNYYSKILLQLCQLYNTGHFIAELTLYQMLESGKNTSLHRTDDCDNVS